MPSTVTHERISVGPWTAGIHQTLERLQQERWSERLWRLDAGIWTTDGSRQGAIRARLGWLTAPELMRPRCAELEAFAAEVQGAGFTEVLLLGMGGSSLCAEVCQLTFAPPPGFPVLAVLDTTDPATIRACEQTRELRRTLFLVSSKSGTTTETLALFRHFAEKAQEAGGPRWGEQFVAITDPGSPLERLARESRFRRCVLNPPDIGGRYSALSYFGLVPAALMGVDVATILDRALRMARACGPGVPTPDNPGVRLGVILAELARARRDKVTFVLPSEVAAFGAWTEQLVAESTGKEGRGLIPVDGEPIGDPRVYGDDRVFVTLELGPGGAADLAARLEALEQMGHPVVRIALADPIDLGAEFFRWELATAVAGALLAVDPFDEPDVQESKERTSRLLAGDPGVGESLQAAVAREDALVLSGEVASRGGTQGRSLAERLAAHLLQGRSGDYLALLAYLPCTAVIHERLQRIRVRVRETLRVATTLGYGPRYLHSTGQLHKGGPGNGLFLQLTAEDAVDLPVPGEAYTFSRLKQAQALGDLQALRARGRRAIRVHLGPDPVAGLAQLEQVLLRSLGGGGSGVGG
ncbi:MAG: transaldolase [Deltaproteobacteria bacterium]|nr:transaldolase [Deltaproteobacteria bacterium]MBI3076827.1 transaldolase [Deltaproteobacteria bacterium]